MKNRKGFTLVEIMIVVVIIGLLAAMAIPAFQKLKYTSIKKEIRAGQIVSQERYEWYKRYQISNNESIKPKTNNAESTSAEYIVINGKTYKLVAQ